MARWSVFNKVAGRAVPGRVGAGSVVAGSVAAAEALGWELGELFKPVR